jgi:aryl sulfotransferase
MEEAIALPVKTREMRNRLMDSTFWDEFPFRNDDIIIGTYSKSGTTWVQQIVGQMLFGPDPQLASSSLSPWTELRLAPRDEILSMLDAQTGRRFIKTHLPADALTFSPHAKYIYIGRDGRDMLWSMHHHWLQFTSGAYAAINALPGNDPTFERPTQDVLPYWREWVAKDGYPFWSFWEHIRSWWNIRDHPHVKLLHFDDLKRDMEGEMRGIAAFLDIDVRPESWDAIARYCTFDWMKAHADVTAPLGGALWEGGGTTFINKGTNGRWRDVLTDEDCRVYAARAEAELGSDCAAWLATGKR